MSGIFSEKVDKVSFEDIPHAKFAPPGLRKVDSMGSRAEEIIYCRPESLEDTDYIEKPYYQGAAGESSVHKAIVSSQGACHRFRDMCVCQRARDCCLDGRERALVVQHVLKGSDEGRCRGRRRQWLTCRVWGGPRAAPSGLVQHLR